MKIDRTFSITALPPNVDPAVREVVQAMAKAIDQLTSQINHLSFGQAFSDIRNGAPAGNFNAQFLTGRVTAAANQQRFFHGLGRVPIGCLEVLTIPQIDDPGGSATNVAGALAITAFDAESISIISTVAGKCFTLLVF